MADARAEEIKALARDYGEVAIMTLVDVCRRTDVDSGLPVEKGAARAAAAKTLLERGFGAPDRRVEQKVDVTIYDANAAHLAALQKLAARRQDALPPIAGPLAFSGCGLGAGIKR